MKSILSKFFKNKTKHYLCAIAIFKNESHGIQEWIKHYLREGVEHFYLIDNGSTDNSSTLLNSWVKQGVITLIHDSTKWAQSKLYNKHFLKKCKSSDWVIICDLDEYIYARNGYSNIKTYLQSRSINTGMIRVPWKMFGSNGHIKQPNNIIQSFTRRSLYNGSVRPGIDIPGYSTSKVMVRTSCLKKLDIHTATIKKGFNIEDANARPANLEIPFHQPLTEELLTSAYVHLNHYAIQSKQWFLEVKCTRGAADGEAHEHVRNLEYFNTYDASSNDIDDHELNDIHFKIL